MNTKLTINLGQGLLEVEGSEAFVKKIYEDFKENLSNNQPIRTKEKPQQENTAPEKTVKRKPSTSTPKKRKAKSRNPSIVKDLNLRPREQDSLDDFVAGLKLSSNLTRNVAFLYYLIHEIKETEVGIDHIYTCYRHLKVKVPSAFYQSIADTGAKGWIDTTNMDNLTLTGVGLNVVEHDLQATD